MNEQLRSEIRNEIELYFEEKSKNDAGARLKEENKTVKTIPVIFGIGCLAFAIFLSFTAPNSMKYLLLFLMPWIVANVLGYVIVSSKMHPDNKKMMLVVSNLIHVIGLVLPLALLEYGYI